MSHSWQIIEDGLKRVMADPGGGIEIATYMAVYSAIVNCCVSSRPSSVGRATDPNEDLYNNFIGFLKAHLQVVQSRIHQRSDVALLEAYVVEWDVFVAAAKVTHHLFRYWNRHYVKREMDERQKVVYDAYTLFLVLWKEVVLPKDTLDSITRTVLELIEKHHHNGEDLTDSSRENMIKVIDSFVELDLHGAYSWKTADIDYKKYFNTLFVEATGREYAQQQEEELDLASHGSAVIQSHMAQTKELDPRASSPKQSSSHPPISTPEKSLIITNAQIIEDKFQSLLAEKGDQRSKELGKLYNHRYSIAANKSNLRKLFTAHIQTAGLKAVEGVPDQEESQPAKPWAYFEPLLKLRGVYLDLINKSLGKDSKFTSALDEAIRTCVSSRGMAKSGYDNPAELLNKHVEDVLGDPWSESPAEEMEETIGQVVILFEYIDDKDAFRENCLAMLAERKRKCEGKEKGDAKARIVTALEKMCAGEKIDSITASQDPSTEKKLAQVSF